MFYSYDFLEIPIIVALKDKSFFAEIFEQKIKRFNNKHFLFPQQSSFHLFTNGGDVSGHCMDLICNYQNMQRPH